MAVSLALLTGVVWMLLALLGLVWRRRAGVRWDVWDALRGVGALAALRELSGSFAGLVLVGDGHRLGLGARAAGDRRAALNLARADLASTVSLAETLSADVREYRRRARALPVACALAPLRPAEFRSTILRTLAWLDTLCSPRLGPAARLRLHLGLLEYGVRYLARCARRCGSRPGVSALRVSPRLRDDLAALTRAMATGREALERAWEATRLRLEQAGRGVGPAGVM